MSLATKYPSKQHHFKGYFMVNIAIAKMTVYATAIPDYAAAIKP